MPVDAHNTTLLVGHSAMVEDYVDELITVSRIVNYHSRGVSYNLRKS
jgi:phosphohistidine phosphatase SixA